MKDGKYVVYFEEEKIREMFPAFEESVPKGDLNKWKLLWYIFFKRGFLWKLSETVKYALIHHRCYNGTNSCDVILFEHISEETELFIKERK